MKFPFVVGNCLIVVIITTIGWFVDARYTAIKTVDVDATKQTKALYANLKTLSKTKILFGQQDALAYGVEWKEWNKFKSDVNDVCGQHPSVVGWDISQLGKSARNIDGIDFDHMQEWIKEVYKMGGINTISYHMDNFDGGSSWDAAGNTVGQMLPGGEHHEAYKDRLDLTAEFLDDLKVGFIFKTRIPIIFRPFHEHTGAWFWWGRPHTTPEEYIALWRYTVEYLRDQKGLHHLLYAYSPDIFDDAAHYLECYPGDEYVDILGFDDYHDVGDKGQIDDLTMRLKIIVELADEKDKVAALTETGYESIPHPSWWTDKFLASIKADPTASRIAWVLVWRNDNAKHHYAPYPNHVSADNFREFCKDPMMVLSGNISDIYKL